MLYTLSARTLIQDVPSILEARCHGASSECSIFLVERLLYADDILRAN